MSVRLIGLDKGVQALEQMRTAAGRFTGTMVRVGSPLVYAWGIETGRRRDGSIARRAGGARYLEGALHEIRPKIAPAVARALPDGPRAVDQALDKLGDEVVRRARGVVPVRSGRLRESIRSLPGRR